MKKIWPFGFYLLYYASMASFLPFIVLFYQNLNFTGAEIGLLTGVPPLITLVATPFWTNVADATRRHRLIMSVGIGVALVAVMALQSFTAFVIILFLILLFNVFFSPVASLADSATIAMLGEERAMYGRIRLGGTLGWGLMAPVAGMLVDRFGLKAAFWGFCALMLLDLFVAQKVVHDTSNSGKSGGGGIRFFFSNRRWVLFLASALLGGIGAMTASAYLFPYMAELGASESLMGWSLLIATVTEIPIFFFGNSLFRRFTSQGLFAIALVMMGIRSIFFALAHTPFVILIIQIFSGTIFPAMWVAGVSYADENTPAGLKSTAQGLFGAMSFGFGAAVGGFIGGPLLESIGGRGMFLVFGLIILGGLVIIEGLRRILPPEKIPQEI